MTRASANVSEDEATTGFGDGAGVSDAVDVGVTARDVGDSITQASTRAVSKFGLLFLAGIIPDQISLPVPR